MAVGADANTYRPFKILDATVMQSIVEQIEALGEPETEGKYRTFEHSAGTLIILGIKHL